jgi:hypothetical protein
MAEHQTARDFDSKTTVLSMERERERDRARWIEGEWQSSAWARTARARGRFLAAPTMQTDLVDARERSSPTQPRYSIPCAQAIAEFRLAER